MGVWSVAWLGVGSARPSFLFGSHFLFSLREWGKGTYSWTKKLKKAHNQGIHAVPGRVGAHDHVVCSVQVSENGGRECFKMMETSDLGKGRLK